MPAKASPVITWRVVDMDRETADGCVTTAHWTVDATLDGCFANAYGSVGLQRGEDLIPFEDLTEETVVGWAKAALGEEVASIEASLAGQIAAKQKPVQASGLPWA